MVEATCDCPYDWGGWCKHIVAILLFVLRAPDSVEERLPLAEQLGGLSHDQLVELVRTLVERVPGLTDAVESQIALLTACGNASPPPTAPARRPPIDVTAIRREVLAAMHSLDRMRQSEAYWHVGSVVHDVRQILAQAWALIHAGDGERALPILAAVTDVYVAEWTTLDDSDGDLGRFFEEIADAWIEALLDANLSPGERAEWADKLLDWARDAAEYGIEDAFTPAIQAARLGWETESLAEADEPDPYLDVYTESDLEAARAELAERDEDDERFGLSVLTDRLVTAQLNVLERQGRVDEFLALAARAGQSARYLTALVRLGRVIEAVDAAPRLLEAPSQALEVAGALRESGHPAEALRVGEHGLELDGRKTELATWLRDLAAGLGERERALAAALFALREDPNLAAYRGVAGLADDAWPERQAELIEMLRRDRRFGPTGRVEIFLDEGLVADAIATVHGCEGADGADQYMEPIARAAVASHPDWVIQTSLRRANGIMDEGRSSHYQVAARWLAHARAAYLASGRPREWHALIADLLAQHARKYRLRPLLEDLASERSPTTLR